MDRFAPSRLARWPATRQRLLLDAEIVDGEVSFLNLPLHVIRSPRRQRQGTPTSSFPSAAGQSVLLVSTGSSSASARLPRCLSRSTHTCCAMPVGSSSRTRTFSTRSGTPKWRPTASRIFGANWRRQARDRFPLDYLGICRRIALGDYLLNDLYALLDCSVVIALTPPECSNFISRGTSKAHIFM